MLTWGALNIIGASSEKRTEIERAQREVAEAVDREITELGIEHDSQGFRELLWFRGGIEEWAEAIDPSMPRY